MPLSGSRFRCPNSRVSDFTEFSYVRSFLEFIKGVIIPRGPGRLFFKPKYRADITSHSHPELLLLLLLLSRFSCVQLCATP